MSTWTPEAIRALGVTTDLPTLGKIFRISRTRAYQMAHTGEWEQAGIRIVPLGGRYGQECRAASRRIGSRSAVRARSRPRSQQPERHRYAPQGKR